jgi:hypothetical protein
LPTREQFDHEIRRRFLEAELRGTPSVTLNAGKIHRELGGYPGLGHHMPLRSEAMYRVYEVTDDLRALPLSMRKINSARLLRRRPDGIFIAPFEVGEIRAACNMGLEGLVSKHRDRAYRGGLVKVKNPESPAIKRAAEVDWR